MTFGLQELVSKQVNQRWLQTVPFFRGLTFPDGSVVNPVESSFLAKVAVALDSNVFAPTELPPSGKLYVIVKGNIRYKGLSRGPGCEPPLLRTTRRCPAACLSSAPTPTQHPHPLPPPQTAGARST